MTDTRKIDIDAAESRIDELRGEYIAVRPAHSDAIGALPGDATLRDTGARRSKAAELTRDALADQERIAAELAEAAADALAWADSVLGAGDYSDGLDGMDRDALTRVFDRAVIRGEKAAIPRLSANYADVRVALEYRDAWSDEPSATPTKRRTGSGRRRSTATSRTACTSAPRTGASCPMRREIASSARRFRAAGVAGAALWGVGGRHEYASMRGRQGRRYAMPPAALAG